MNKNILIVIALVLVGIGVMFALQGKIEDRTQQAGVGTVSGGITQTNAQGTTAASHELDDFAKCLTDKGAKMYGASWCSHCQNQKQMFGASVEFAPYVECASADGGQTKVCTDAGIQGYPTWKFADGSENVGEASLQKLSEATGCPLPEGF